MESEKDYLQSTERKGENNVNEPIKQEEEPASLEDVEIRQDDGNQ